MAEQRKIIETKLSKDDAYKKCFKRATQLNLDIRANIQGERLEVVKGKKTGAWWTVVILGFIFYIIPGVLMLIFWKPESSCILIFSEDDNCSTITVQIKGDGEGGTGFFNEVSGLLM
jgi:hypothetical protein